MIMNIYHRFQNFRQFSDLFSKIRLNKWHTSFFSGICREIRIKFIKNSQKKSKIRHKNENTNFWWNFVRISRQIPEKSDVCRFFNQICENKLENCRKFWDLWSLFIIIHYFSFVSLDSRLAPQTALTDPDPRVRAASAVALTCAPTQEGFFFWTRWQSWLIFPSPRPTEGPLTATTTSPPARGRAVGRRWVCGRVLRRPPYFPGHLQISWISVKFYSNFQKFRQHFD